MFRVLVSDKMSNDGLLPLLESDFVEIVQKNVTEAEDELHTFDALLVRSATKVTKELYEKMTSLKIVTVPVWESTTLTLMKRQNTV